MTDSTAATGVASLSLNFDDLPDPDEDFLDLNESEPSSQDPTQFVKPTKDGVEKGGGDPHVPQYILGTLVVRVVSARDLEPVQKGGIGQMVRSTLRKSSGTANPYASVKFGNSTQRSSEVFDNLDPIWPRQETMFMDVSLPLSKVTHPNPEPEPVGESASAPHETISSDPAAYKKPPTVLTVAIFHTPEIGRVNKYPSKGEVLSGDSDDLFLGMASIDLARLFTGREHTIDEWLRLSGTESSRGSVRIVCEYEASDSAPRPGDYCRFTSYCHPRDLYPLLCGLQYRVTEVDGDTVLISYTSQEGWVCSFQAHRYMLICGERHHDAVETAQDELASMAERLSHSPLVHSITETAERVAVDGLLDVGEEVVQQGFALFNRWFSGGVERVISDVEDVTNWDGRYNPDNGDRLGIPDVDSSESLAEKSEAGGTVAEQQSEQEAPQALPNMPCCPITGEPMVDPMVAADGHTYERSAIARWFTTSNKSPMTGAILGHTELVPNFGLLSSVQESAAAAQRNSKPAEKEGRVLPTDDAEMSELEPLVPDGLDGPILAVAALPEPTVCDNMEFYSAEPKKYENL